MSIPSVSRPLKCLAGLLLVLSAPMLAAQQATTLSDRERAERDASKVLSFIKFHAVRAPKPASPPAVQSAQVAPVAAQPRAMPAVAREQDGQQVAALQAAVLARSAPPAAVPATAVVPAPSGEQPGTTLPPASEPPASQPVEMPPSSVPAPVEPEPEPEEVDLKLIQHVQPELPRGNNLRNGIVRVRFTVASDGSVQKVTANEGAQRRLATSAIRAVQQWRFEPIAAAKDVEVDLDFRFEE